MSEAPFRMSDAERVALLTTALNGLLARISSTPTMSGHLTAMYLMKDHGESRETSDALRYAKLAVMEAL